MRKLLLGSALAFACVAPASADVILDTNLSGTGDNVVFDSLNGNLAIGSFNGTHTGLVDFTDLSNTAGFLGAANGNDIKISNTSDLKVQVFSANGLTVLPTATDVFSLKGSGDVSAVVTANEIGGGTKLFTFDLGALSASAQSGFTLTAINGESINLFTLVDAGGTITDFEHYRIDVASPLVSATPLPAALPMFLGGLAGFYGLIRRKRKTLA
jgi:hypothetical protein